MYIKIIQPGINCEVKLIFITHIYIYEIISDFIFILLSKLLEIFKFHGRVKELFSFVKFKKQNFCKPNIE